MNTKNKPRPIYEARVGLCRCAVWANKTKNGEERLNATVSRLYARVEGDGQKTWAATESFSAEDIPLVQKALDQAFDFMTATPAKQEAPESEEESI